MWNIAGLLLMLVLGVFKTAFADDAHASKSIPNVTTPPPAERRMMPNSTVPAARLQESMKLMQEQMAKLRQAQDPREKERLLNEHLQSMDEHLKLMHAMFDAGAIPAASAGGANIPTHILEQRLKLLEQRVGAMQRMMEQLREHQEAQAGQPKK